MIPTQPLKFWQFFDFYTLAILFVVVGLLIAVHYRKTGTLLATISHTVAHSRQSSVIFSMVMTICFPLYYAFIWLWVGPLLHMPVGFYYLLAVSALSEMIFVWIPATTGRSLKVHEFMSGFVGVAMLAAPLLILVYGRGLSSAGKVSILIFTASAATLAYLVATPRLRRFTFHYETIYCAIFLATISVIAHS